MDALGLQKDCDLVLKWKPGIIRHLYWCAATTPDGNPDVMEAKWVSITEHIRNKHTDFQSEHYRQCSHGVLVGRERKKKWMKIGKIIAISLGQVFFGVVSHE